MILPNLTRAGCSASVLRIADAWTEDTLQTAVLNRAGAYGWRRQHQRPARVRPGKAVTAIAGDVGWPDTVAVHPSGVLLVAELKTEGKYPNPAQRAWLDLLASVPGVLAGVWRPRDWHAHLIDRVLEDPIPYLEAA